MMTTDAQTTLALDIGLDRALAFDAGGSVRYLVADLAASGTVDGPKAPPPVNLALAIDVSSSMEGDKIVAARDTALAVARALTPRDRLTIVTFSHLTELLLDGCPMDSEGHEAAQRAISRLEAHGNTNLWDGWLLAGERVALAMSRDPKATHRVLLLSDGQANAGVVDPDELAQHAAGALARGIITSAVGIGDGYDEHVLGSMAESGGGRLHDAEHTHEIGEVVLGELREGRAALVERATLRVVIPANVRAEVVGAWAHTVLPGAIDVAVGSFLPTTTKRVVLRLHCPSGKARTRFTLSATAHGMLPGGAGTVEADPSEAELRFAVGRDNTAQVRDIERSVAAFRAWQADAMKRTVDLNREGNRRGAKHYLSRELRWMESYARGLPGSEPLIAELVLLMQQADEELDPRLRKELRMGSMGRMLASADLRVMPRASVREMLEKNLKP
jgi:Ca-activated chloride channel family protein